jgi:hypothetical protein
MTTRRVENKNGPTKKEYKHYFYNDECDEKPAHKNMSHHLYFKTLDKEQDPKYCSEIIKR